MLKSVVREAVKQVPSLTVLGVIVYLFIGALQHSNTFITGLTEACHQNQTLATECIRDNTRQMGRVEKVLEDTIRVLAKLNGR